MWSREPLQPAALAWARSGLQFAFMVGQGFVRDHLLLRAHSLTFLSILSVVPLLALAVSMVELFGVTENLTGFFVGFIAAGAPEAAERIPELVTQLNFGALGTVGAVALLSTTVLMIGSIERSLNAIWGIHSQRPWVRRIPDYLAVLLVAPLLLGVSISLGTSLRSQWLVQRLLDYPLFTQLWDLGLRQAPTLFVIVGFTFLYWFLPNTSVRLASAGLGAVFAGLLFTLAQQAYVGLNVGAARYNALFAGFAWFPLFMVWLYFSWAITLLGAEVAYAHQTLRLYRREVREAGAGAAARESIGLAIALEVARAFRDGSTPWSDDALSERLDVPVRTVRALLARLGEAGLLAELGGEGRSGTWQLARPADRIRVADVIEALRGPRLTPAAEPEIAKVVTEVFARIDRETAGQAGAQTLRELVELADRPVDPLGSGE